MFLFGEMYQALKADVVKIKQTTRLNSCCFVQQVASSRQHSTRQPLTVPLMTTNVQEFKRGKR